MHLRALELVGSVNTEASMESEKASFGGPDWQEPAGVPKCFIHTLTGYDWCGSWTFDHTSLGYELGWNQPHMVYLEQTMLEAGAVVQRTPCTTTLDLKF